MRDQDWDLVKTVIDKALTLSGHKKDTYLNSVYRENPAIRAEIEELLRSIEESEAKRFMKPIRKDRKELISDLSGELENISSRTEFIGQKIGAYRITEKLGSGGMGAVFKAERTDGEFRHTVAIKLIKTGVDSEDNIRRFRMEREILAGLHHPNIAQLHDGGVIDGGSPYLIMEYIDGMPIDVYCNKMQLTINERLHLYNDICAAVQFAHINLVVHRDLKAQNIYVTSEGIIKILDFGIAKLLNSKLNQKTLVETQPGQKFWTPQYAAPEQIQGEAVTTATDIYALGVLLHNLLTDTYPLNLQEKSLIEIEQVIKDTAPSSPSQTITNHPAQKECAKLRKTTLAELKKVLQGDLDALVLKAVRKEPECRYASVSQLSEDVDRYKSSIPLIARKGTLQYRASKFIRRHKAGLAAAAVFLIAAIGFSTFYTSKIAEERDRVQLERDKAEQVSEFLTGLFKASNPVESQGDNLTGEELLVRGVERAEELKDQPAVQAEILYVIGRTYRGMNKPDEAIPILEKALKIQRNYWKGDQADIAHTLNSLASVNQNSNNLEAAEKQFLEALAMRRRLHGDYHPDVFTSMNNLGLLMQNKGELEEAEKLFNETLEARIKYYGEEHPKVGISLNNLAYFLEDRGNLEKAEIYYRQTAAMWRKLQGSEHSDVALVLGNLAEVLRKRGKFDEAEKLFKEALAIRRKVFGDDHMQVAVSLTNLAMVEKDKKYFKRAERTNLEALNIFNHAYGTEHWRIAACLVVQGRICQAQGHFQKAEEYYRKALAMRRTLLGDDHIQVAYSLKELGTLYLEQQEPKKAEPLIRQALPILQNYLPTGDWRTARLKGELGVSLAAQARELDAEPLFLEEYETLKSIDGIEKRYIQEALDHLINLYEHWQKPELAEPYKKELALAGDK